MFVFTLQDCFIHAIFIFNCRSIKSWICVPSCYMNCLWIQWVLVSNILNKHVFPFLQSPGRCCRGEWSSETETGTQCWGHPYLGPQSWTRLILQSFSPLFLFSTLSIHCPRCESRVEKMKSGLCASHERLRGAMNNQIPYLVVYHLLLKGILRGGLQPPTYSRLTMARN